MDLAGAHRDIHGRETIAANYFQAVVLGEGGSPQFIPFHDHARKPASGARWRRQGRRDLGIPRNFKRYRLGECHCQGQELFHGFVRAGRADDGAKGRVRR